MGETGIVVWGKSGELVNYKGEKESTVDQVRYAALDELRERQQTQGTDAFEVDRKKLVLLDHLGDQPRATDAVSEHKYIFVFMRPGRDQANNHPDALSYDFPEHAHLETPTPYIAPLNASLTSSQRLQKLKELMHGRTDRYRTYSQIGRNRAEFCNKSSAALQLQTKARDAVCAHICQLAIKVTDAFTDLQGRAKASGKAFEKLLDGFPADMKRLASTPLHPSLQGVDGRVHLSDCVQNISPWKDSCHEKWQGLVAKLQEFESDLSKVKAEVEDINNALPG
eukprot:gene8005-12315_t